MFARASSDTDRHMGVSQGFSSLRQDLGEGMSGMAANDQTFASVGAAPAGPGHVWLERAGVGKAYLAETDTRWAHALNSRGANQALLTLCRVCSRLADGILWYALILALPFAAGKAGVQCAIHMVCAGLTSLAIYLVLKRKCARTRPYEALPTIKLHGHVLDKFSFPSGHTLHSVGFSLVLAYHFPMWALALVPFTIIVALSRIVLGVHYPSDVLGGALLGALIGLVSVVLL